MNKCRISYVLMLMTLLCTTASHAVDDDIDELAVEFLHDLSLLELQEVEVQLDDVFDIFDGLVAKRKVSVASGKAQKIELAPSVTSLITAQDIEAMGARDLDEVLKVIPGLYLSYNWMNTSIYTMRGISSSINPEILLLINGIRYNGSQDGSKFMVWGGMPVNNIERIEVIRGSGSAVYGADAFSGVINIITKQAQDIDGTEVGTQIGNFHTRDVWLLHGSELDGIEVAAAVQFTSSDGHRKTIESDAQTVFDRIFGTNVSLAPGDFRTGRHNINLNLDVAYQHWRLRTEYQRSRDIGQGVGPNEALPTEQAKGLNNYRHSVDLTYHNPRFSQNWELTAQASYQRTQWDAGFSMFLPPGAYGGRFPDGMLGGAEAAERHSRFNLSGFYRGFNRHTIRVGAGYSYDDQYKTQSANNFATGTFRVEYTDTPRAFSPEVARSNRYGFIQDTWQFADAWELTAGVRYDQYSDFGSATNPRIGLVWETTPKLTSKLLYGRAFRAPSFNELFLTTNPVQQGNRNLKPETINTYELAFNYQATQNLNLALNLYHYDIEDKIIYVLNENSSTTTGTNQAQNAGQWTGNGLEFEMRWKTSSKSSLLFNYAYQHSKDKDLDRELGNAPNHQAYLRTDWLLRPNWYLNTQLNWMADWSRVPNDPRNKIPDYTTVDLTLRRKDIHNGKTNFAIGVKNAFNANVRSPSLPPNANGVINVPNDLPQAGRYYFVELRYRF